LPRESSQSSLEEIEEKEEDGAEEGLGVGDDAGTEELGEAEPVPALCLADFARSATAGGSGARRERQEAPTAAANSASASRARAPVSGEESSTGASSGVFKGGMFSRFSFPTGKKPLTALPQATVPRAPGKQ